ncbi:hypothetical protein STEG23_003861 [Scotinomys teguina]
MSAVVILLSVCGLLYSTALQQPAASVCGSYSTLCYNKAPDKSTLGTEGVVLVHGFKVQVHYDPFGFRVVFFSVIFQIYLSKFLYGPASDRQTVGIDKFLYGPASDLQTVGIDKFLYGPASDHQTVGIDKFQYGPASDHQTVGKRLELSYLT